MAEQEGGAKRVVVLCVLDGWGLRAETEDNAVAQAETPNFDALWASRPHTTLSASGADVGLPDGQIGNSEVGHMNLGAGRVVWMDLPKIDRAIEEARFATRPVFQDFAQQARAGGGLVHLLGLMSTGGVHAHQRHLIATTRSLVEAGLSVRLHLFLDGRDTPPKSALGDWDALSAALSDLMTGAEPRVRVATVSGRFYALDRDKRWDRVEAAYRAIAGGEAAPEAGIAPDPRAAIEAAYARGETDEFVLPTVIGDYAGARAGDALMMTHFRADRAREILSALLEPAFDGFERKGGAPAFAAAMGMVEYSDALNRRMTALFPQEVPENGLGAWLAAQGRSQFRIAETEKYPHVTFFFNGGVETPLAGEARHMAPSPKVRTYDLQPEMAAADVTDALTEAIVSKVYDLIVVNFANPDMVGHTGDLSAAIRAVEAVDRGLGAAVAAVESVGGAMLVTADHGNCEMMRDPKTGEPHTAHTTNPVPAILLDARSDAGTGPGTGARPVALREGGRLADVAPTLLALLGLRQPAEMTGESLITEPAQA